MKLIIMNGTCLSFGMMFNPYGVNKPSGPCFLQYLMPLRALGMVLVLQWRMPYGHRGWCWCYNRGCPAGIGLSALTIVGNHEPRSGSAIIARNPITPPEQRSGSAIVCN
jgi:hypothetical protein